MCFQNVSFLNNTTMNTEFDDLLDAFLNDELETKTKNADDNMVEEPLY